MKRILILILFGSACFAYSQNDVAKTTPENELMKQEWVNSLDARLLYGYNSTWENYGGLSAYAKFKLPSNFVLSAGVSGLTSNVYNIAAQGEVLFPVKQAYLIYVTNQYLYRAFVSDNFQEFNAGLSVGFNMNYFGISLGNSFRFMSQFDTYTTEQIRYIVEPFNLIYSIEGEFRKRDSDWNIGLRISNLRQFMMERMYQPTFNVYGFYKVLPNLKLYGEFGVEPAGIFNMAANSYDYYLQLGVQWLW